MIGRSKVYRDDRSGATRARQGSVSYNLAGVRQGQDRVHVLAAQSFDAWL